MLAGHLSLTATGPFTCIARPASSSYPVCRVSMELSDSVELAGAGRPRSSFSNLTNLGTSDRLPSNRFVSQQALRNTGSGGSDALALAAPSPSTAQNKAGEGVVGERSAASLPLHVLRPPAGSPAQQTTHPSSSSSQSPTCRPVIVPTRHHPLPRPARINLSSPLWYTKRGLESAAIMIHSGNSTPTSAAPT